MKMYRPRKLDEHHSFAPALVEALNQEAKQRTKHGGRSYASNMSKAVVLKELYYQAVLGSAGQYNVLDENLIYYYVRFPKSRLQAKFHYMKYKSLARWLSELIEQGWAAMIKVDQENAYLVNFKRYDDAVEGKLWGDAEIEQWKKEIEGGLPHSEEESPHGEELHLIYNTTNTTSSRELTELSEELQPDIKGKPYTSSTALEALSTFYESEGNRKACEMMISRRLTKKQFDEIISDFCNKGVPEYYPNKTTFSSLNGKFRSWAKRHNFKKAKKYAESSKFPHRAVEEINDLAPAINEVASEIKNKPKGVVKLAALKKMDSASILRLLEPLLNQVKLTKEFSHLEGLSDKELVILALTFPSPIKIKKAQKLLLDGKQWASLKKYKSVMGLIKEQAKFAQYKKN